MKDIRDGSSSTLLVGERTQSYCEATWVGSVTGARIFPPAGSPAAPELQHASGMTLGHTQEGAPNAPDIECNNFSSAHAGGAQDGHRARDLRPGRLGDDVFVSVGLRGLQRVHGHGERS